jgi:pyruvate/2-oxoglutarate dehydrogenase complex dihydrolipoamide acyltransferase (E2) component
LFAVPGQGFHDWRIQLLARNFTNGTVTAAAAAAAAASSSNKGSESPKHKWINIVGYRDQLPDLPGPPKLNTTHNAALQRWKDAQALLAEAAARQALAAAAQAAANAAAAAAASAAAVLSGPPLAGAVQLPVLPAGSSPPAAAAAAAAAAPAANESASSSRQSDPKTNTVTSSASSSTSSSNAAGSSKQGSSNNTSFEQVELALMSFVRRSPGSGLSLQLNGKPWLMMGFDMPHVLQLAVQHNKRGQLLELMDQAKGLGFNMMRVWAFADGGMRGVGSAVKTADRKQQQGGNSSQEMQRPVMQPAPGILNATVMR